jgi:hypothetical protein
MFLDVHGRDSGNHREQNFFLLLLLQPVLYIMLILLGLQNRVIDRGKKILVKISINDDFGKLEIFLCHSY